MNIQPTTIFQHTNPHILTKFPGFFDPHLALWEILLNQSYTPEYIQEEVERVGAEEAFTGLIQNLININQICVTNPETGEILWNINTKTGEEYEAEEP